MGIVLLGVIRSRLNGGEFAPEDATNRELELYERWAAVGDERDRALIAAEAIGLNPFNPPKWALLTCWIYVEAQKRAVHSGNLKQLMPDILDHVIIELLEDQDTHWERQRDEHERRRKPPPFEPRPFEGRLADAIRRAIALVGAAVEDRTVRRRWEDEQEAAEPHDEEDAIITGYRNTRRVVRIYDEWSLLKSNPDAVPEVYQDVVRLLSAGEE